VSGWLSANRPQQCTWPFNSGASWTAPASFADCQAIGTAVPIEVAQCTCKKVLALCLLPLLHAVNGTYSYSCVSGTGNDTGSASISGLHGDLTGKQYNVRLDFPGHRAFSKCESALTLLKCRRPADIFKNIPRLMPAMKVERWHATGECTCEFLKCLISK
jgi:hypothetical protein